MSGRDREISGRYRRLAHLRGVLRPRLDHAHHLTRLAWLGLGVGVGTLTLTLTLTLTPTPTLILAPAPAPNPSMNPNQARLAMQADRCGRQPATASNAHAQGALEPRARPVPHHLPCAASGGLARALPVEPCRLLVVRRAPAPGLQAGSLKVAGGISWGCRRDHLGLQAGSRRVAGGIT